MTLKGCNHTVVLTYTHTIRQQTEHLISPAILQHINGVTLCHNGATTTEDIATRNIAFLME